MILSLLIFTLITVSYSADLNEHSKSFYAIQDSINQEYINMKTQNIETGSCEIQIDEITQGGIRIDQSFPQKVFQLKFSEDDLIINVDITDAHLLNTKNAILSDLHQFWGIWLCKDSEKKNVTNTIRLLKDSIIIKDSTDHVFGIFTNNDNMHYQTYYLKDRIVAKNFYKRIDQKYIFIQRQLFKDDEKLQTIDIDYKLIDGKYWIDHITRNRTIDGLTIKSKLSFNSCVF